MEYEPPLIDQGIAGLTDRDIKLVVEGGYHTVESIAYTSERQMTLPGLQLILKVGPGGCLNRSRASPKPKPRNC